MKGKIQASKLMTLLPLLTVIACGPRVEDDQQDAEGPDVGAEGCEESSCPLACGDRTCVGGLGIGRCVEDMCSPTAMGCVIESSPEDTCTQVCAQMGVVCVENGCEGATIFGYPGPEHLTVAYCGESTSSVRDAVERIPASCDVPLAFTGERSFEVYQCCCDDPDA